MEVKLDMRPVLVLGATGNVGPHVVAALLSRDAPVRVLARNPEKAQQALPSGVDIHAGDAWQPGDVTVAAEGATAVFLLSPHSHDMADLQLRVIRALRRTGVRMVKLSGTSSAIIPDGPQVARQHWEIEQVLAASGQPFVILRSNSFMQTLIDHVMLPALRSTGAVPNPIGEAGISLIDARDVGEVAAEALLEDRWAGQTLVLTGPRAVRYEEIARLIGAETGLDIPVSETTPEGVGRGLLARGMDPWEAEHFSEMYQLFRNAESESVTDDVQRVTGKPPRTVEAYLHERRQVFAETLGQTQDLGSSR